MTNTDLTVLNEILSEHRAQHMPTADEDEHFEFFTAKMLLRDHQLDPEEIRSGLVSQIAQSTNPGTDGGIDAMYLVVNGKLIRDVDQAKDLKSLKNNIRVDLVIIQSTLQTGFGVDRVLRLKDASQNIFEIDRQVQDFTETYNSELLDCINRFREAHRALISKQATTAVHFYLATRGNSDQVAEDVRKKSDDLKAYVPEVLGTIDECNFAYIGARDLIKTYRQPPKTKYVLTCKDTVDHGTDAYIAFVKLPEYFRFITGEKDDVMEHLFEANVRDYEGDAEVNLKIRETLGNADDNADFWWLNNGVTILATSVSRGSSRELSIEEPLIVNGLQTSTEIFNHFRRKRLQLPAGQVIDDPRHVVVRVIGSPDPELQDRIIRATNSQTKIPAQYLRATEDRQRDIELVFRTSGLHYDRRKDSWRKQGVSVDRVVGITELAQAVAAAYLQEPDHARARPSRYLKEEYYPKVFTRVPLELYVVCARLRKVTEEYLRGFEQDRRTRNNLLFYVLMTVVCMHLRTPRASANSIADVEVENIDIATYEAAAKFIVALYQKHGASDQAAKGKELVADLKSALIDKYGKKKRRGAEL